MNSLQDAVQDLSQGLFGLQPDALLRDLPVFEEEDRRHGHYAALGRSIAALVDVDLVEFSFAGILLGEGVKVWRKGAAWSTPCGTKVDYDDAAFCYGRVECFVCKVLNQCCLRFYVLEFSADRNAVFSQVVFPYLDISKTHATEHGGHLRPQCLVDFKKQSPTASQ